MQTSFQEFLRQKIEGSDWKDRSRRRTEWLNALNCLLGQIQEFLREADPEELLEIIRYEVESRRGATGRLRRAGAQDSHQRRLRSCRA